MDRAQVEETLDTLIAEINADRDALAENTELKLSNVGQRVNDVCTAAVDLPKEDAVAVQERLQELKVCLSALSNDLEQAAKADQAENGGMQVIDVPVEDDTSEPKQD